MKTRSFAFVLVALSAIAFSGCVQAIRDEYIPEQPPVDGGAESVADAAPVSDAGAPDSSSSSMDSSVVNPAPEAGVADDASVLDGGVDAGVPACAVAAQNTVLTAEEARFGTTGIRALQWYSLPLVDDVNSGAVSQFSSDSRQPNYVQYKDAKDGQFSYLAESSFEQTVSSGGFPSPANDVSTATWSDAFSRKDETGAVRVLQNDPNFSIPREISSDGKTVYWTGGGHTHAEYSKDGKSIFVGNARWINALKTADYSVDPGFGLYREGADGFTGFKRSADGTKVMVFVNRGGWLNKFVLLDPTYGHEIFSASRPVNSGFLADDSTVKMNDSGSIVVDVYGKHVSIYQINAGQGKEIFTDEAGLWESINGVQVSRDGKFVVLSYNEIASRKIRVLRIESDSKVTDLGDVLPWIMTTISKFPEAFAMDRLSGTDFTLLPSSKRLLLAVRGKRQEVCLESGRKSSGLAYAFYISLE